MDEGLDVNELPAVELFVDEPVDELELGELVEDELIVDELLTEELEEAPGEELEETIGEELADDDVLATATLEAAIVFDLYKHKRLEPPQYSVALPPHVMLQPAFEEVFVEPSDNELAP